MEGKKRATCPHVQVHQKHMFVVATEEEWVRIMISRSRGNRRARGGDLSVNTVVKTQHGMIRGTVEFEERSLYPIGKFDELIQDRVDIRGTRSLIGKCPTKMPNRLGACRLNYPSEGWLVGDSTTENEKKN
jgi:hypothetical protein